MRWQGSLCLYVMLSALACGLSIVVSIWYWGSLAAGEIQVVYQVCGFLFEAIKLIALPSALASWRSGEYQSCLFGFVVFALLSAASIYGGVSTLNGAYFQQRHQALASSSKYQQLSESIALKKDTIAQLKATADKEYAAGFKTRASKWLQQVSEAESQLVGLQQALWQMDSSHFDTALAHSNHQLTINYVLGTFLELATGYILFLTGKRSRDQKRSPTGEEKCSSRTIEQNKNMAEERSRGTKKCSPKNVLLAAKPCGTRGTKSQEQKCSSSREQNRSPRTIKGNKNVLALNVSKVRREEKCSPAGEQNAHRLLQQSGMKPTVRNIRQVVHCGANRAIELQQGWLQSGLIVQFKNSYIFNAPQVAIN